MKMFIQEDRHRWGAKKSYAFREQSLQKCIKKDGHLTCCHVLGIECYRHDRVKQMYPIPA